MINIKQLKLSASAVVLLLFVGCTSHYGNQTLAKKSPADLKKRACKG